MFFCELNSNTKQKGNTGEKQESNDVIWQAENTMTVMHL